MKTIQEEAADAYLVTDSNKDSQKEKKIEPKSERKESGKDLVLNVGFEESLKRGLITVFLPWTFVFMNPYLVIAIAPVMSYLLTSAITHFCFIRYAWQHWIRHIEIPTILDFAPELSGLKLTETDFKH